MLARSELVNILFGAFMALAVAFGVGRTVQLGEAYHEGRLMLLSYRF